MDLSNLPEEKILEICQNLNDEALAKFMRTSGNYERICSEILQKRKDKYFNAIKNSQWSKKISNRTYSDVYFQNGTPGYINKVSQIDWDFANYPKVESVFPSDIKTEGYKDIEAGRYLMYRETHNLSEGDQLRIMKKLKKLGYTHVA